MKDVVLIVLTILMMATVIFTTAEYLRKCNELETVERINIMSNRIMSDNMTGEFDAMNDEQLTEALGL